MSAILWALVHATMVNTIYGDEQFIQELNTAQATGINTVRYPLWVFNSQALSNEQYFDVIAYLLVEFDRRLKLIEARNLKAIILLGSMPGGKDALSDQTRIYALIATWQVIAKTYDQNNTVIAYELLNEPHDAKAWNRITPQLSAAIRDLSDKTIIIGHAREHPKFMAKLKPVNLPNIVYAFHFYIPQNITFQGITKKPGKRYKPNLRATIKALSPVLKFAQKHHAAVFNSEFGCSNKGRPGNQLPWISTTETAFQNLGIGWTYNGISNLPFDLWSPYS